MFRGPPQSQVWTTTGPISAKAPRQGKGDQATIATSSPGCESCRQHRRGQPPSWSTNGSTGLPPWSTPLERSSASAAGSAPGSLRHRSPRGVVGRPCSSNARCELGVRRGRQGQFRVSAKPPGKSMGGLGSRRTSRSASSACHSPWRAGNERGRPSSPRGRRPRTGDEAEVVALVERDVRARPTLDAAAGHRAFEHQHDVVAVVAVGLHHHPGIPAGVERQEPALGIEPALVHRCVRAGSGPCCWRRTSRHGTSSTWTMRAPREDGSAMPGSLPGPQGPPSGPSPGVSVPC